MDPESVALRDGEYVAVRRFTRLLERGAEAKAALDQVVDRAGALVNLRTAISRYRKPRRRFRFFRCASSPPPPPHIDTHTHARTYHGSCYRKARLCFRCIRCFPSSDARTSLRSLPALYLRGGGGKTSLR